MDGFGRMLTVRGYLRGFAIAEQQQPTPSEHSTESTIISLGSCESTSLQMQDWGNYLRFVEIGVGRSIGRLVLALQIEGATSRYTS